jgi:hypothetical protein
MYPEKNQPKLTYLVIKWVALKIIEKKNSVEKPTKRNYRRTEM